MGHSSDDDHTHRLLPSANREPNQELSYAASRTRLLERGPNQELSYAASRARLLERGLNQELSYVASRTQLRKANPDTTRVVLAVLSKPRVFTRCMVAAVVILFLTASCAYSRVNSCSLLSTTKHIVINGSPAFAPLVQDVANEYQKWCPIAHVVVKKGDLPQNSINTFEQLKNGIIDIGTSDVFATPDKHPDLKDYQVAVIVFALVVNDDVDIGDLSTEQVRNIYSRGISDWRDAKNSKPQDSKPHDIVLVSRPLTSDTRSIFEKYVLSDHIPGPQPPVDHEDNEDDAAAKYVKSHSGAIGYVSLYNARKYHLKILSIDGNKPGDSALVKKDIYRFWTIERMYTKGVPNSPVYDFIEHMFSTAARQIISQKNGYLDLDEFSRNVLISHES